MKSFRKIKKWYISASLLLFIYSCQKEDSNEPDLPPEEITHVTDYDGNTYSTVTIGSQVWMAENLKVRTFLNGDSIPTTSLDVSGESAPIYQWAYDDDEQNATTYGRLYTWYVVNDKRKICPDGWHVPSDPEWQEMISFLGGNTAGGKMKEAGTSHWQAPNLGATNETGFTALPGGYRSFDGHYVSIGVSNYLWSTTPDGERSWGQRLHYNDSISERWSFEREAGVSVRCIKDQ